MAHIPVCPDPAILERYLRGQVPAAERPPLEDHLARCPACRASLQALRSAFLETQHLSDNISEGTGSKVGNWATAIGAASEESGSACSESFPFLAPPQQPDEIGRLARYRILKQLGAGGMGMVFLAEDLDLQRLIALKVMLPEAASKAGAGQRFLREARLTASIKSDHIVTIHQVGEDHGAPFLAMELLEGSSLEGWLRNSPQPDLREVIRLGREVALGLAAAHQRGLIHRDVKPANVWLEAPGDRVKILDFGLAWLVEGGEFLTHSGTILGTPAYMAPEQADGQKVDARCDLFSLGCVLFRLCTGQSPFQGGSVLSTLEALATHTPPLISEARPDAPPELARLVASLLARAPEDRPASARAVADELAASAVALATRPPSGPGKAAKQRRGARQSSGRDEKTTLYPARVKAPRGAAPPRRRLLFVAAGAVLLALLLVGIGFWRTKKVPEPVPAPVAQEGPDQKGPPVAVTPPDRGPVPAGPAPGKYRNDLGMELVLVPKGKAWLDGAGGNPGGRQVEIKEDYYLGAYEVTQEEWQTVMGPHDSYFSSKGQGKEFVKGIPEEELKKFPVESVSWNDVQEFLKRLNESDRRAGWVYRLPTQTEWDYACRGGPSEDKRVYNYYLDKPTNEISWKDANVMRKLGRTCKVGSYRPNSLGLYDMHGNVAEWTNDTEKRGDILHGVTREGDWMYPAEYARIQFGGSYDVSTILTRLGFRVARVRESMAKPAR